jgi:menaquinol-cytochrome c reductase iron-sulfur subunit
MNELATPRDPLHDATVGDHDARLVSRRRFLSRVSLALTGVAGAVISLPIVAYLLSPLVNANRGTWVGLGPAAEYRVGETVEVAFDDPSPLPWAGQTARTAVWLRRDGDVRFTAFAVNCTHLGCPVNWRAVADLFFCPCHGGVYYADGTVAAGPPPRPLTRYEVRLRDGQVEILNQSLSSTLSSLGRRKDARTS